MSTVSAILPVANPISRARRANQLRLAFLYLSRQLHIDEAAKIGGVSRRTILRWRKDLLTSDDPIAEKLRRQLKGYYES